LKSDILLLLLRFAEVAFNLNVLFRVDFDSSPFPTTAFAVFANGENQPRSNNSSIADMESKSKEKLTSKIPRRLIFTYKYDLLKTKLPFHIQ
jgi:hypothetical protein